MSKPRKTLAWVAVLAPSRYAAEQDLKRCYQISNAAGLRPSGTVDLMILDIPDSARFQWVDIDADTEVLRTTPFTEWRAIEGYNPGPEAFAVVDALQVAVATGGGRL